MSETKNLKLFKHEEPLETNNNKFDIDKALNKNWDKVDDYAGEANSKIDLITEIIDLLPKVSNEGESITLENTARAKFTKFRIEGNSSQETRSGKNKIIFDDIKETVNQGITCSIKNGVITLNGTASGVVNFYSNPINISAGKYTLSKNMEGTWSLGTATSSLAILLQQKEKDGSYTTVKGGELTAYSSAKNFTTLDLAEGTYRIRVFIATGNILNNFTWRPQLEEGENFTGFEQGGLMPSVEFPSEIRNVGDNENLYDKDNPNILDTPIDTSGLGGNVKNIYKTVWIPCKPNTTYTVSKKYDATKNRFALAYSSTEPGYSQQVEGYVSNAYTNVMTITTNSTAKYLIAYVWIADGSTTYQEMLDSIKIEKGTQSTADSGYGCGNIEIVIRDKNLLDAEKIVKDSNNERFVYFDENKNVVFTTGAVLVIVRPVKIKKKTEYTYILRCKSNTTKLNSINFIAKYTDGSQEVLSANKRTDTNEFVAKFKTNKEKTLDYVTQGYTDSASTTLIADASMILEGDYSNVNIELNNAKKQAIVFPFKKGQRLMEGDYLADDGIHNTKTQIQLDGVTNGLKVSKVTKHSNNIYYCVINLVKQSINNTTDVSSMYCSHFMPHFEVKPGSCYITGSGLYLVLVLTDQTITTVDAANTWLATQKEKGIPVVIEYKLAEEVVEPYTEVQKEAYEQTKNAISYKGQTNIFSTNEIKPIFKVEALADIGLLLNNMQAQILAGGE